MLRKEKPGKKQLNCLLLIMIITPAYNHFYELPVYKACRTFGKKISTLVIKYFHKTEEYHLKVQVLDPAAFIFRRNSVLPSFKRLFR
ncbi:MAG: hypothetical protein B6D37_11805 [Sphingobacteriales bacterium UTBCD1]|nr:MAG: hypothetical protein B6D37_11805 [Sphingobacteriales bacterium UTBCD1]